MRRLVPLLLAACSADPAQTVRFPDDETDQPPVQAACASDLGKAIFDATRGVIDRGTVPAAHYSTQANAADPRPLIDGPQIFPAFRALIASAQHHVSLQTYVWEPGSDPANEILAGLTDLARRRASEAPNDPPVTVRFLFDVSTLNFGSTWTALPRTWASVQALGLDARHVRFELAGFYHLAMGNLHVKTLVVDGRDAIVTGANPQAHHNYAAPWRDAGFRFSGDVAVALLGDFDNAWRQSQLWTCGAREDVELDACGADPQPIEWTLAPSSVPASTCTGRDRRQRLRSRGKRRHARKMKGVKPAQSRTSARWPAIVRQSSSWPLSR